VLNGNLFYVRTASILAAAFVSLAIADGRFAIQGAEPRRVPYWDHIQFYRSPLDYNGEATDNPLVRLQKAYARDEIVLNSWKPLGYLPDLLKQLAIPVDSQVLVPYTGSNNRSVSARRPRAFYFRDDMVIAYVAGQPELEIAVYDAQRGTVFFSVEQEKAFDLRRRHDCLVCHNNHPTALTGVPGHLAAFEDFDGRALTKRWHGRYVTGGGPGIVLSANYSFEDQKSLQLPADQRPKLVGITDRFETSEYLSPHSDIVANLILDHQIHVWNWIARLNIEHQLNLRSSKDKADLFLASALLHTYQEKFDGPITGTSEFTDWYIRQAPRDPEGRSLSELDLHQRLFRYGVSPMIYSRPFQQLPGEVRRRIYSFIDEMLAGTRPLPGRERSPQDRALARSILRATIAEYRPAEK